MKTPVRKPVKEPVERPVKEPVEKPVATLDLSALFHQLISYRNRTPDGYQLGPWLQQQLAGHPFPNLTHLPFSPASYTRNCIAKESASPEDSPEEITEATFEALIMRWDGQVKTSVHGHPKFSFYYVISGLYEIDRFVLSNNKLEMAETQRLQATETTWFQGQSQRYDNWIHRVRCLEPGLTFHVYSDDAQKGVVFA